MNPYKPEIYILENCPPPKKNKLIEVRVFDKDEKISNNKGNFSKTTIKYVHSWKQIDPSTLIHRKTRTSQEFIDFFKIPFVGETDYIEMMSNCISLYAISSPQLLEDEKGGLNTALLGKKNQWNAFKRLMDIIPKEFKKPTSNNFYKFFENETVINPVDSSEISLAYYNPPTIPVQIPVSLDAETKAVSHYKENVEFEIPMIRSYIIDSLLYQPEIPAKLDSDITNCVYELVDKFKKDGYVPYNQDLGSVIPKLSSSISRLNFNEMTTKEDINNSFVLWSEMFEHSKKIVSTQLPISKLIRLSDNAKKLYIDINDAFGTDELINKVYIMKISNLYDWEIEDAIRELNLSGAIIRPNNNHIKLLELR